MASRSSQSLFYQYNVSSDDEECLMPNNFAETTPGQSNRAARLLTATRFDVNPPPNALKNWWQINPNVNDYHSDRLEMGSIFKIPDITNCGHQQEETHP
jgi:hypothetical protein